MLERPKRRKYRQETVIHSYIVRPIAQEIVLLLWNTNITANQITVFRVVLNFIALICFAFAQPMTIVIGFLLFQTHEILDHVDGEYARQKKQTSHFGQYLEHLFDVTLSTSYGLFGASIAFAAYKLTGNILFLWLFAFTAMAATIYISLSSELRKSDKPGLSFSSLDHHKEEFLTILGSTPQIALRNVFLTIIKWHNQLLLWSILYLALSNSIYQAIPIIVSSLFIFLLYQLRTLKVAIRGYQIARSIDLRK